MQRDDRFPFDVMIYLRLKNNRKDRPRNRINTGRTLSTRLAKIMCNREPERKMKTIIHFIVITCSQ